MGTPTPPPGTDTSTMPDWKTQQDMRAGNISVAGDGDWTSIRVYTGRSNITQSAQKGNIGYIDMVTGKRVGATPDRPQVTEDIWLTAGEVANEWFTMKAEERERYKDTFILMGLVDPRRATDTDYSSIWISYVKQLALYNQPTANWGTKMTVGDLIMSDLRKREQADPGLAELMQTGKRTTTKTATNLALSNQLDANALMDAAARALLGRKASEEESKKLLAAVNELERANPEVTTTTQETDMYGEVLNQSSETSGGISAAAREQLARQQAEANPEYGAYQAATTYMGSFMDMVYGQGY